MTSTGIAPSGPGFVVTIPVDKDSLALPLRLEAPGSKFVNEESWQSWAGQFNTLLEEHNVSKLKSYSLTELGLATLVSMLVAVLGPSLLPGASFYLLFLLMVAPISWAMVVVIVFTSRRARVTAALKAHCEAASFPGVAQVVIAQKHADLHPRGGCELKSGPELLGQVELVLDTTHSLQPVAVEPTPDDSANDDAVATAHDVPVSNSGKTEAEEAVLIEV